MKCHSPKLKTMSEALIVLVELNVTEDVNIKTDGSQI